MRVLLDSRSICVRLLALSTWIMEHELLPYNGLLSDKKIDKRAIIVTQDQTGALHLHRTNLAKNNLRRIDEMSYTT